MCLIGLFPTGVSRKFGVWPPVAATRFRELIMARTLTVTTVTTTTNNTLLVALSDPEVKDGTEQLIHRQLLEEGLAPILELDKAAPFVKGR